MLKRGFSFAPGFRLEQFLGRGQFGQVWQASAPGGTAAAIKFIDLSGGEGAKEHEGIKRVKQIRHANLMPITAIWLLDAQGKPIEEDEIQVEETMGSIPIIDPTATMDVTGDQTVGLQNSDAAKSNQVAAESIAKAHSKPEPAWLVVAMLLGGKSLQNRLRECVKNGLPGIPPKELLAYMDETAKGLDFLNTPQHDMGSGLVAIQHCDVKPANIVLIGSSAVVCDFGLARILSRNQVTATSASGTPAYMAPEAIAGKPSKTSDQYSLAVTYYHLRTGTLPISDGTLWEVLDAHRSGKLDLSRVPEQEQAVLRRATALDWEKRFESNGDFVESLRDALRAEGHTRPIMSPQSTAGDKSYPSHGPTVNSASTPTEALDPSLTLVPGIALQTPGVSQSDGSASVAPGAETAKQSIAQTVAIPASASMLGASLAAAGGSGASIGSPAVAEDDEVVNEPRGAWWLQPQWLGGFAIAAVLPMLMMVLFSGGKSKLPVDSDATDVVGDPVKQTEPQTMTVDQLIARAISQFSTDPAAARQSFLAAAQIDSSLLSLRPAAVLSGHTGFVRYAAFAADGQSLVTIADDHQPLRWSLQAAASVPLGQTFREIISGQKLTESQDIIESFRADASAQRFVISNFANQAYLSDWSGSDSARELSLGDSTAIAFAWHPGGRYLVAATDQPSPSLVVIPVSATTGSVHRFSLPGALSMLQFDDSGDWLVGLQSDSGLVSRVAWKEVERWFDQPGSPSMQPVTSAGSPATSIATVPAGNGASSSELIVAGDSGDVTRYSLDDASKLLSRQVPHAASVTALAVTKNGSAIVTSGDAAGQIGLWDPASAQPVVKLTAHQSTISSLVFAADDRWLAAGSFDGSITVWDTRARPMLAARLESDAGPIHSLAIDPRGKWLVSGHEDGVVLLWDFVHAQMASGEEVNAKASETSPSESPKANEAEPSETTPVPRDV